MAKRFAVESFEEDFAVFEQNDDDDDNQTPVKAPVTSTANREGIVTLSVRAHVPPVDPRDQRGIAFTYNVELEAETGVNTLWDLQGTIESHVNERLERDGPEYAKQEWRLFAAKTQDEQGKDFTVSHQTFRTRAETTLLRDAFRLATGSRRITCYGLLYAKGTNEYLEHMASTGGQIIKRLKI